MKTTEDKLVAAALAVLIGVLLLVGLSEWGENAPPADSPGRHEPRSPTAIAWPPPAPPPATAPLEPPAAVDFDESSWYLTHSEAVCIALVVWAEARGEPLDGKLAVADVVLNRQKADELPCDVIRKFDQFAVAGRDGIPKPADGAVWRECLLAAVTALHDRQTPRPLDAHTDRTRGARCMLSPANMPADRERWPAWARGKPLATIGGHAFFDCMAAPRMMVHS